MQCNNVRQLSYHTGWEDLANYVLRVHISLVIPETGACGLVVEDEVRSLTCLWLLS